MVPRYLVIDHRLRQNDMCSVLKFIALTEKNKEGTCMI